MNKKIAVIGAGFGGLTVACLLAKKGNKVTVFEKNSTIGGRARMLEKDGFSFDMGPSWYLMPDTIEEIFNELGYSTKDMLDLQRLDPNYKMFFDDEEIEIFEDMQKNYELFERLEPGCSKKIEKYLKRAEYKYNVSMKYFIEKPFLSPTELFEFKLLKESFKLDLFKSFGAYLDKEFKSDKLKKILGYTMVFLGGSPKNTPALYSLITHSDFNLGVFYPKGGMTALAKALEKIAIDLGVEFVFDADIKKINVENSVAKSISYSQNQKDITFDQFDELIANADYAHVEMNLLEEKYQSITKKQWEKKTIAPSGLILYLGIKGKIDNLRHHNLMIVNDWMQHFNEIFDDPRWPENPSYYVCNPNKTENGLAPKDCENLFVLMPVAAGIEDDNEIREQYALKLIEDLEKRLGVNIKDNILVKEIYSQRNFLSDYNSYKGTALGLSQTLFQSAMFRPKNVSKKVSNLFFVGQYTNPGTGVPTTMISGKIVSNLISKK